MEQLIAIKNHRSNFVETLHQEFLSARGYGANAYLSSDLILKLFNQFLDQQQSEQVFIKNVIKKYH